MNYLNGLPMLVFGLFAAFSSITAGLVLAGVIKNPRIDWTMLSVLMIVVAFSIVIIVIKSQPYK